jgi:hypothetical protein
MHRPLLTRAASLAESLAQVRCPELLTKRLWSWWLLKPINRAKQEGEGEYFDNGL